MHFCFSVVINSNLPPLYILTATAIEAARAAEKAQQIADVFAKFDVNDDGVVTYEELVDGLKRQFKAETLDEKAVKRLFSDLDKDGNEVIDASEFKLR